MKATLLNILNEIYRDIEQNKSISLLGGGPGIALFKLHYLKHLKGNDLSDVEAAIQELSELSISYNNLASFSGGQAGINWFFKFLSNEGYIEKEDYNLVGETDHELTETSLAYLNFNCYDYLHGALGIAHHLLYTKNKTFKPFFNKFLDSIISLMNEDKNVLYYYDFNLAALDRTKVNPSLSHGLTSVLKFCMECYQNNIYKRKSQYIAKKIVTFLLKNINADHTYCYFPYIYDLTNNFNQRSRLSWCYGDLTIAYILYQYALLFDNKVIEQKALEILRHSAQRRSDNDAGVVDAGFCHGTSGIDYIFNKLWFKTEDISFYDASHYWFQQTIDHSIHKDGLGGFKRFDNVNKAWVKESGLLEGVAGIGLSIIGYLFNDYSWDYCLMLND
jgi:hypothetical protein